MQSGREMKWFTDPDEWLGYINKYMANGIKTKTSMMITIETNQGEVIAKWSSDGSGQVFEGRTKERLNAGHI